jgi:transposase
MGRVNTPPLSADSRKALESGFRSGERHCFRLRCQVILLKADGRSSKEVGLITGMSHVSVNGRVKRFALEGISGLQTKPGQGRKPLLDIEDKAGLLLAVKAHRQRLCTAKAEGEASRGKSVSESTLRRFLKVLAEDINA